MDKVSRSVVVGVLCWVVMGDACDVRQVARSQESARLSPVVLRGGGLDVPTGSFFDHQLGVRCSVERSGDQLVCLPLPTESARLGSSGYRTNGTCEEQAYVGPRGSAYVVSEGAAFESHPVDGVWVLMADGSCTHYDSFPNGLDGAAFSKGAPVGLQAFEEVVLE